MAEIMDVVIIVGLMATVILILGGLAWLGLTVWEYLKSPCRHGDDKYVDDNDIFNEF